MTPSRSFSAASPPGLANRIRENLIYLAWAQAVFATLASLYLSEVMGFPPCNLCWYQRIAMYPLIVILTAGIVTADPRVRNYVIPISLIGLVISGYHSLLYYDYIPTGLTACSSGIPCEARWIEWLGFAGIPFAAFTAFTVIILATIWHKFSDLDDDEDEETASVALPRRDTATVVLSGVVVVVFAVITGLSITARLAENARVAEAQMSNDPVAMLNRGQQLYSSQCAACHGPNGEGVPNLGLPLANSTFLRSTTDDDLIAVITDGRLPDHANNQTGLPMPGMGSALGLSDDDIRAVIAYLRTLE